MAQYLLSCWARNSINSRSTEQYRAVWYHRQGSRNSGSTWRRETLVFRHDMHVQLPIRPAVSALGTPPLIPQRSTAHIGIIRASISLHWENTTTHPIAPEQQPNTMALQFAGRHCVVVGATGVIGSSIAKAFAQHGAVVSLLGRSAVQVRHKLEPQLRPYSLPETGDGTGNAAASDGIPSVHRFIRLDASNKEEIKALFSSRASPSKVNTFIYIYNLID